MYAYQCNSSIIRCRTILTISKSRNPQPERRNSQDRGADNGGSPKVDESGESDLQPPERPFGTHNSLLRYPRFRFPVPRQPADSALFRVFIIFCGFCPSVPRDFIFATLCVPEFGGAARSCAYAPPSRRQRTDNNLFRVFNMLRYFPCRPHLAAASFSPQIVRTGIRAPRYASTQHRATLSRRRHADNAHLRLFLASMFPIRQRPATVSSPAALCPAGFFRAAGARLNLCATRPSLFSRSFPLFLCRAFHSPTHAPSPHTSAYGYSPADCAARSRPGLSLPTRSDLRPNRVKPDGTQLFHGSAAPAVGLLRVSVRKARHKTHKNRYYKFLMQISTAFSALKINATRIAPHSRPQPSFRAAQTPAAGRPRRDSRTLDRND